MSGRDASDRLLAVLQRPELRPLVGATELRIGSNAALPPLVASPGRLVLAERILDSPAAAIHLRYGLELAWLLSVTQGANALCALLAARCAGIYRSLGPTTRDLEITAEPVLGLLSGAFPGSEVVSWCWENLAPHQLTDGAELGGATLERLAAAWELAAPTEHLLTAGGDSRLHLDPETGLNRYGCATRPRPHVVTFSSCTASSISERGFAAAEACRRRLLRAVLTGAGDRALAEEADQIRNAILAHYDVADLADIVLSPSGTDASLLLTAIVQAARPAVPLTTILLGRRETGSGIALAVTGRHFATLSAGGRTVVAGEPVDGYRAGLAHAAVPMRDPAGHLRSSGQIDLAVERAITQAVSCGRVLLHLLDTSKTGVLAPSARQAAFLAKSFNPTLEIAIDACQARLGPRQLRQYLAQGSPVLVTGSKFFTGPPFCGAILLPHGRLEAVSDALPAGLRDYSAGFDWDVGPPVAASGGNVGLLLRWAAALAEMKAFAAVPDDRKIAILDRFGTAVTEQLAAHPWIVPTIAPAPTRPAGDAWSERQTIFTFGLRDPAAPERLLDMATLGRIHRWLYRDLGDGFAEAVARRSCHIGQPVELGRQQGRPIGALRIAAGARLVSGEPSHAALEDEVRLDREIADLGDVIAKVDLVLRASDELAHADRAKTA